MTQADRVHSTQPLNTSITPAESAGALYLEAPVSPEEAFHDMAAPDGSRGRDQPAYPLPRQPLSIWSAN